MVPSIVYNWQLLSCLNCTPTCSVAMLVLEKFMFLWRSTEGFVDVMSDEIGHRFNGNSEEGGVAAEMASSQTGL